MTAAELLAANIVLDLEQVAVVLNLRYGRGARKGEPDRRLVAELIKAGRLRGVDPEQPSRLITVSCAEVCRYLAGELAA